MKKIKFFLLAVMMVSLGIHLFFLAPIGDLKMNETIISASLAGVIAPFVVLAIIKFWENLR